MWALISAGGDAARILWRVYGFFGIHAQLRERVPSILVLDTDAYTLEIWEGQTGIVKILRGPFPSQGDVYQRGETEEAFSRNREKIFDEIKQFLRSIRDKRDAEDFFGILMIANIGGRTGSIFSTKLVGEIKGLAKEIWPDRTIPFYFLMILPGPVQTAGRPVFRLNTIHSYRTIVNMAHEEKADGVWFADRAAFLIEPESFDERLERFLVDLSLMSAEAFDCIHKGCRGRLSLLFHSAIDVEKKLFKRPHFISGGEEVLQSRGAERNEIVFRPSSLCEIGSYSSSKAPGEVISIVFMDQKIRRSLTRHREPYEIFVSFGERRMKENICYQAAIFANSVRVLGLLAGVNEYPRIEKIQEESLTYSPSHLHEVVFKYRVDLESFQSKLKEHPIMEGKQGVLSLLERHNEVHNDSYFSIEGLGEEYEYLRIRRIKGITLLTLKKKIHTDLGPGIHRQTFEVQVSDANLLKRLLGEFHYPHLFDCIKERSIWLARFRDAETERSQIIQISLDRVRIGPKKIGDYIEILLYLEDSMKELASDVGRKAASLLGLDEKDISQISYYELAKSALQ